MGERAFAGRVLRRMGDAPEETRTWVQALRIGDLALVSAPGELFVELGLEIKRRSPFAQTMVLELANDSVGYLPTRRAYEEGAYEPEASLFGPGVGEQIAEGPLVRLGYSRRRAHERALELMRLVGIPDPEERAEAYAHELSGGMRQRVMIAIALSLEPKLILCDEPTTALDVTIQDQILKLLASLREQLHVSIVFVSHDLAVIAQTCSRVAVMYAGQVVETGPVESVFREPRHPYTLGLLRSVPDVDDRRDVLATIPGAPPDLADPPSGCRFHPRCPFAQDDCIEGDFPLRSLGGGRETACIHHDRAAEDVRREPVIAGG